MRPAWKTAIHRARRQMRKLRCRGGKVECPKCKGDVLWWLSDKGRMCVSCIGQGCFDHGGHVSKSGLIILKGGVR